MEAAALLLLRKLSFFQCDPEMVEMKEEEQEKERMAIIKGKEEALGLRVVNMFVAMALWLGPIHFNVALIVFSICFLPISKAILLVVFIFFGQFTIFGLIDLLCLFSGDFEWIPGKILRCFYDKDFRSDTIENVLCESLFPTDFSVKDKVKHWARIFSVFDNVEMKALEKILEQKQRLQQEMQKYMSLRQLHQDGEAPEIQKKILFSFRIMSRSFAEPGKAEENFQFLDQLKDANIWKIMTNLIDPNSSFQHSFGAHWSN